MNANDQTNRDLTIAYIENALTEVSLLHDTALIEPTLEKFHIERSYARFHGLALKPGKFRPRVGFKPRTVYTVTDKNGIPLGDPIHEDDLGAQYAEAAIEQVITANLAAMLTDHNDLVALHRTGGGGVAPSFRYKPASALAERTDNEASLEKQKTALREHIMQLRERHEVERNALNAVLDHQRQAENALDVAKLSARRVLAREKKAQQVIDRAARMRQRELLRQGALSSPWGETQAKSDNGLELG